MDLPAILWHIFAVIGCLKISYTLSLWLYWKLFCRISLNHYKYGYVLITGATDGIGKSIAKEFVSRKFKVLLISRSQEKLERVKSEFLSTDPLSIIELIATDFSESHKNPTDFYKVLNEKIQKFPISILVNNVGVANSRFLDNQHFDYIESIIGINTYPSTFLTHFLIPLFLERFRRTQEKSLIINICAGVDETIVPGNAVYSASKRYNAFLSEGLRYEYKEIQIVTARPCAVQTPLLYNTKNEDLPLQCTSEDFAKDLLNGLRTGVSHIHWKHKLLGTVVNFFPYLITVLLVRTILPMLIRKGLIKP